MLLKDYYTITSQSTDSESGATLFHIRLNGGHEIYKGHFPEKAVSPGVCNLQIMKECAERIVGKELTIKTMAQCKMPAMITPDGTPELTVSVKTEETADGWQTIASIFNESTTYITFKGLLIPEQQ
ncbi:MAG: hydroxymyristoyl-ACP dehydratase [Salinivirgaceae bacterium]|nr:hydroxymyristoyl-ACP dehydratase [Salinivirgaceae bacterium]